MKDFYSAIVRYIQKCELR